MKTENNRNLLIIILALLAFARFVLLPVVQWQAEQVVEIKNKTQRLYKVKNVINRLPEIESALKQLELQNKTLKDAYYNAPALGVFKLQQQQQIEKLFSLHSLKVTNFNWIAEVSGEITEVRAKVRFSGKTKDIALFQLDLASLPQLIEAREWSLRTSRMNDNSLGRATGSVLLVAYNQVEVQP